MSREMPLGFRIVGACTNDRMLVDYDRAFLAYASCDQEAKIESEGYLSPFQYDEAISQRCQDASMRLDVRGFNGPCWSRFVWFDIDRTGDIVGATNEARRLASFLLDRYELDETDLLVFFSGSKGYHLALPTSLFNPQPAVGYQSSVKQLAVTLAEAAEIGIDTAIYSKVQPLRAPNSRHRTTGRQKRFLTFDELLRMKPRAIVDASENPQEFDLPSPPAVHGRASEDWKGSCNKASRQTAAMVHAGPRRSVLNQLTLDFIRDGADEGKRQKRLYSAAANLAEFGFTTAQACVILKPSALDCGLTPGEVDRTINCAINN